MDAAPFARTVDGMLRQKASLEGDRPFVRCGSQWVSLRELDELVDVMAGRLRGRGLGVGDRVAVLSANRVEVVELFFACGRTGIVLVPLNCFLKGQFLQHQMADSGAEALVGDKDGVDAALEVIPETRVKQVLSFDPPSMTQAALGVVPLRDLEPHRAASPPLRAQPPDLFAILYTSGATGLPRGCMIPNGYYFGNADATRAAGWVEPGDRIFTAFPLFHMSGHHCLMSALVNDASVVFEPSFSASSFMSRATAEKATVLMGVGPMALALLLQPPDRGDTDRRFRMAMMTPMPPEAQASFEARFNTPLIAEGYGQTECSPATISSLHGERRRGTVGRAVEHIEVRIVDDDDNEVALGQVGEIVLRPRVPDVVFRGYWNNPEATGEAWRNLWHHTGDIGSMDADGFVTFVDRKKDALRRRGENVSSFELEAALQRHPSIAQVAVSAVPSPLGEDDIKASIVFAGEALTPEELFAYCRQSLPYFAIPRYIDVRPSLPVNALGRVQKHVLRDEGVPPDTWDLEKIGLSVEVQDRRGR